MLEAIQQLCSYVCHALPERTFSFGGRPLPLCARCVGVYLGFALTLFWFAATPLRRRRLVPGALLWLMVVIIALFAVLGFAGLYGALLLPDGLRFLLGAGFGFALGTLAFPLVREWFLGLSSEEWRGRDVCTFLALPVLLAMLGFVAQWGPALLFWPIVVVAVLGLVGSHFLADLLILKWLLLSRRSWSVRLGAALGVLAMLMCAGEFLFYAAWRRFWQVV